MPELAEPGEARRNPWRACSIDCRPRSTSGNRPKPLPRRSDAPHEQRIVLPSTAGMTTEALAAARSPASESASWRQPDRQGCSPQPASGSRAKTVSATSAAESFRHLGGAQVRTEGAEQDAGRPRAGATGFGRMAQIHSGSTAGHARGTGAMGRQRRPRPAGPISGCSVPGLAEAWQGSAPASTCSSPRATRLALYAIVEGARGLQPGRAGKDRSSIGPGLVGEAILDGGSALASRDHRPDASTGCRGGQ
jgi:hypothetical protein